MRFLAKFFLVIGLGLVFQHSHAAATLFFVKAYDDDFKKHSSTKFMGGDPVYGLVNVSIIAVNDNVTTSVADFADAEGNVLITVFFPSLNKQISWKVPLTPGLVKKNRFLFAVLPDKILPNDNHTAQLIKILYSMKGTSVQMGVRVGSSDGTFQEGQIAMDLTQGLGALETMYNQMVPAAVKNTNTFYNVCESKSQTYVDFQKSQITVTWFTSDSIAFDVNGTKYSCKKIPDFDLLAGGKDVSSFTVTKVDDQSFLLFQRGWKAYAYYHMNPAMKDEPNNAIRCRTDVLDKLDVELKRLEKVEATANQAADAEQAKRDLAALTTYARTAQSRRSDPTMQKQITDWWNKNRPNQPATRVFFVDDNFFLVRDEFNQVLRKLVGAVVVYKDKQGHCGLQWNAFGFENQGGGSYVTELTAWKAGYKARSNYELRASGVLVYAGVDYTIDCR